MREMPRRDGSVALYDDDHDEDLIIVEPTVAGFDLVQNNLHCACGRPLQAWSWRSVTCNTVELVCDRCHRVHAHFRLGTRVHR
jgi:hypothetical protein